MSLATLGAVSSTTNELPLPDTSSLSLGEALILSGGGGTTEAVVIRSIASGRNIGVTVNRGALGTLQLAHTAPTTVSAYNPSGVGGGSGVTVDNGTDPPVDSVTPSSIGALYVETTNGTLYIAIGATSADWLLVGGVDNNTGNARGVARNTSGTALVLGGDRDTQVNGNVVGLTSAYAMWNGSGEGLFVVGDGVGGYSLVWNANGETIVLLNTSNQLAVPTGGLNVYPSVPLRPGTGGIIFGDSDPHIAKSWWDDNGVLTRSGG